MLDEQNVDPKLIAAMVDAGSASSSIAEKPSMELAKAIELPLRKGELPGDVINGIFEQVAVGATCSTYEMPLDLIAPGTEDEIAAFAVPNHGYIPAQMYSGDYVQIPTYRVAAGAGCLLKYIRDAQWDVVSRLKEVMRAKFVKKFNDDGVHVLLSAGADRGVVVYDADAANGQFTKRLLSLGKLVMRRNGGGNTGSVNRRKLTDVLCSPECMEDIRNWGVDQLDETTRREIYTASDDGNTINRIYGVNLMDLDELGDNQEYQLYYENILSGTMASGDVEILIGMDLSSNNSFIMPVRQNVEMHVDESVRRSGRFEMWGDAELGFGCLDNRSVVLFSV